MKKVLLVLVLATMFSCVEDKTCQCKLEMSLEGHENFTVKGVKSDCKGNYEFKEHQAPIDAVVVREIACREITE